MSLLTDVKNLLQDLLVFQQTLRDLEVRVAENLQLRIRQTLAEKLLPRTRR